MLHLCYKTEGSFFFFWSYMTVPANWQGRIFLTTDYSLHISSVNENDFGIFKCEQHELMASVSETYKLYQGKMRKRHITNICYILDNNPDITYIDDCYLNTGPTC